MDTEEIALFVSVLSLVISGLAIAWDRRTARKLERMQLAQVERELSEQGRATVLIRFERGLERKYGEGAWAFHRKDDSRVWLGNDGPATATEVMIVFHTKLPGEESPLHPEDRARLPLTLEPRQEYPLRLRRMASWSAPGDVILSWHDGSGHHQRTERIG